MAEAKLNIEITAQVNQALGRLGAVEDKLEDLGKAVQGSNIGQSLNQIGQGATALGQRLTSSLGAIGTGIIQTAGNFEASMNNVVAVTGVAGQEFEQLEEQAKELGRTTSFSASQAADAMGFLGMAGFETNEIISALPGVLQLASASGMDLAETADRASNVLGGFNLEVEELSRVNNVLAETARSANTDVRQLAEAFKDSGPIATSAGVEIELLSAAAGLLGDAGIQGSLAGTALKNAILGLNAPSERSANAMAEMGFEVARTADGSLDLVASLQRLSDMNATTEQLSRIFGRDIQLAGVEVLLKNLEGLSSQERALQNVGETAAQMSRIKMQGFAGQMKQLQSAFEGLQLAIADTGLLENVTLILTKLTAFTSQLSSSNPALLQFGVTIGVIAFAVGAILIPLGMIISSIGTLVTLFSSGALVAAAPTFTAIGLAIWTAVSPLLVFVGTAALIVAALASIAVAVPVIIGAFALLISKVLAFGATIVGAVEEFLGFPPIVSTALSEVSANLNNFAGKMFEFGLKIIGGIADGVRAGVSKLTGAFKWVFDQAAAFLPFSDAKKGPLSHLTASGRAIPETMAQGMQQGQSGLQRQLATTLAPAALPSSTNNISTPINMTNNINVNGSMNQNDKRDLMAELDAKGRDLVRMVERVTRDNNRTKYV